MLDSADSVASSTNSGPGPAKLIVTGPGTYTRRRPRSALKRAIAGAKIQRSGFPSGFILEAEGDVIEIAKTAAERCSENIGHVTAVYEEVESWTEPIKGSAVRIGTTHIAAGEKFSFRLHKRGAHSLAQDKLRTGARDRRRHLAGSQRAREGAGGQS